MNPVFQFLDGKHMGVGGWSGHFRVRQMNGGERLVHVPVSRQAPEKDLTDEVERVNQIAAELGFRFPVNGVSDRELDKERRQETSNRAFKMKLFAETPDAVKDHPMWAEYVDEAEHIEGTGYWREFTPTPKALQEDFELYVEDSAQ